MTVDRTIFWDGFGLQSLHSGVGRHAFDLLLALQRQGLCPSIIPSHPQIHDSWQPFLAPVKASRISWMRLKPLSLWQSGRQLEHLLQQRHPSRSIIHGLSNYNLPSLSKRARKQVKCILTVHDLIPLLMPEQVSTSLQAYLRWQMPRALEQADAIICVSRWTQQTLEDYFPSARGKSFVIPNGVAALKGPLEGAKPKPGGQIRLLTVSRYEGYKRLDMITPILERLPAEFHWDLLSDAGGRTRFEGQSQRLRVHVGLSNSELDGLYRNADIYVHPSLLEGFCLPAAQAVQWRVPLVYNGGSGIDETVGLAGEALPATASPEAWADKLISLATRLDEWRKRCEVQGKTFLSWDEVAARTLKVYGIFEENSLEAVSEQNS